LARAGGGPLARLSPEPGGEPGAALHRRRFRVDHPNGGKDFTVQEVVERSGQSLRSFYQHFDGKHELLLALFEESVLVHRAVPAGADQGRDRSPRAASPFRGRVLPGLQPSHRRAGLPARGQLAVVTDFAQQLLTERPKEAARAFVPIVSMFSELIDQASAAGVLRSDLPSKRVTGVVLEAIMFNAFSSTISGASNKDGDRSAAEELWDLFWRGIGTPSGS
jgi:AcrR family transcriptional regulator